MTSAPPPIIYGTAWKQEATADLAKKAARAGYRAFDCANQKKHYREDYLGEALGELSGTLSREALFLQSKYTFVDGQDHRLPYDPQAEIDVQVLQSFEGTLKNLRTDYLDSYLLHGPSSRWGMAEDDWAAWKAMEKLHRSGRVRMIGVSNVGLQHLLDLDRSAAIKPMAVQNRCYASRDWDKAVREFCAARGIVYQGFSLLTANPDVVADARVGAIARRLRATPEQVVLRFAVRLGILPLTGTTDPRHMKDDLDMLSLELADRDVEAILAI